MTGLGVLSKLTRAGSRGSGSGGVAVLSAADVGAECAVRLPGSLCVAFIAAEEIYELPDVVVIRVQN